MKRMFTAENPQGSSKSKIRCHVQFPNVSKLSGARTGTQIKNNMAVAEVQHGKAIETVKLSYSPSYPNALSWSPDGRLSVITDRCVYVLTPISSPSHPSLNLERTSIPISKKPFQADVGIDRQEIMAERNSEWYLEPRINDNLVQSACFKKVAWSPLNCDRLGRCVIATLFSDFQLRIHICPTVTLGVKWREVYDLSSLLSGYLKKNKFKINEDIMPLHAKASESVDQISQESKYSRFVQRVQMLTFTSLHWFSEIYYPAIDPSTPKANDSFEHHQFSLLATGTQSGHVIFWKVTVPVQMSNPQGVQLQGFLNTNQAWPSSLAWQQVNDNHGILAVGSIDGFIKAFSIELFPSLCGMAEYVLWGDKDGMQVHLIEWLSPSQANNSGYRLVACKGSSVIIFYITVKNGLIVAKPIQKIVTKVHRMPITGLHCIQNGTIFTCSMDCLVQILTDDANTSRSVNYDPKKDFSCYGIGVSPNGIFISLFLAPSSHTHKSLESHETHILFVNIACGLLSITQLLKRDCLQMEKWDMCKALQYFIHRSKTELKKEICQFAFMGDLEGLSLAQLVLRHHVLSMHVMVLTLQNDDQGPNKMLGRECSDELECTTDYMYKYLATGFLRHWMDAKDLESDSHSDSVAVLVTCDWLVMKYPDSDTLHLVNEVYQFFEDVDGLRVLSSLQEKLGENENMSVDRSTSITCDSQVNIQEEDIGGAANGKGSVAEGLDSNDMPGFPAREKCQICDSSIPLESITHGTCLNGHKWQRCCVSFLVCADLIHKRCQDCSRCVSNPHADTSTWLCNLLQGTSKCPFCLGFFRE